MNDLLLLISPPASGKTYWIQQFKNSLENESLLVISPLRALADECKEKWGDSIVVMTPEEWMVKEVFFSIVIFDEIHLNYYWGNTFRPLMWEVFYALTSEANLVILLTATVSLEMKESLIKLTPYFNHFYWCDFGNLKLKNNPEKYFLAPSEAWMSQLIFLGPRGGGVNLIFCPYRQQVWKWCEELHRQGFNAWGFVGGEAGDVSKKLKHEKLPDFIVATTVLSHGVNLPEISCIFFLYQIKNQDFWIQMVARGGRKGEKFEVFSLEKPFGIKWNVVLNLIYIFFETLKMHWKIEKKEMLSWLLKD